MTRRRTLAAASARMRGRPGRPQKPSIAEQAAAAVETGRILPLRLAASYLGVSTWTVRDLEARGLLPRVALGLGQRRRRLLFDVQDLDALIESRKERR